MAQAFTSSKLEKKPKNTNFKGENDKMSKYYLIPPERKKEIDSKKLEFEKKQDLYPVVQLLSKLGFYEIDFNLLTISNVLEIAPHTENLTFKAMWRSEWGDLKETMYDMYYQRARNVSKKTTSSTRKNFIEVCPRNKKGVQYSKVFQTTLQDILQDNGKKLIAWCRRHRYLSEEKE